LRTRRERKLIEQTCWVLQQERTFRENWLLAVRLEVESIGDWREMSTRGTGNFGRGILPARKDGQPLKCWSGLIFKILRLKWFPGNKFWMGMSSKFVIGIREGLQELVKEMNLAILRNIQW
jgi:hypothetical protein